MTRRPADTCPDLESIAAYLDRRVSAEERARIAQHLTRCEDCYALFTESAQVPPSDSAREQVDARAAASPWWRRPRLLWPAGMAAAASLVAAVGLGLFRQSASESAELRALVVAVGPARPIEPRLSGGFAHAPLAAPMRSAEPPIASIAPDVRIAAAEIEKLAAARRTARTLQLVGIASLTTGELDRGVAALEQAAGQPGADARTFSDLAAAYIARGARAADRQDLMKALAAAERAVGADAGIAEAWFNRALALERMGLADQARQAWLDYLKIDGASPWASEARSHVSAIDAQKTPR